MKILLLEDDYNYRQSIKEYLEDIGYEVDEASDGLEACNKIKDNTYHLLILDIKVPEISGHEVMKYAKRLNLQTPIMIMTSLIDIDDMAIGYDLGCNEYLKKPFNLAELKFRVNELMRKYYARDDKNLITIASVFNYNTVNKTITNGDKTINLSSRELDLLNYLLYKKGSFVTINELISELWDEEINSADIRMHVMKIRQKTADNFILSKRGLGYKLNV
ncbi:two-component system response regulator [Campylobacter blaseri]|uniref:Two-component system response regulator n=1 Tax=Campylobacter blaseri TaxID=2042961 RepID=A0A2P8QYK3_9BACT|nr:response regulator transcription factor [Campylobacter blaseri]PSM51328.1 two-component system response regulator [Campylobacter blaseri]PSM52472.1 two-component system response regulator [Campylobacter blaseri]QKF86196.1 two-component system response regulator [Campylobacter blaseri]